MIPAKEYFERFLFIKTKSGSLSKLILNPAQNRYYDIIKKDYSSGKPMRYIILKARQMGFSTLTEAFLFYLTVNQFYTNSLIVAHIPESTSSLYNMFKLFLDNLPIQIKPMTKYSNTKELTFENPTLDPFIKRKNPGLLSSIKVATAGSDGVGRGSTIRNVHISEYAFWEKGKIDTLNGILQAVPMEAGTFVAIESTANGYEAFKELWDKSVAGESGFTPLFFPWFEMPDYSSHYTGFELTPEELSLKERFNLTNDQLEWRRRCIRLNCQGDVDKFKQEYPSYPEEAFLMSGRPFFNVKIVQKRIESLQKYDPIKIGRFYYDYDGLKLSNIRFVECDDGEIAVFEEPGINVPYVLGGDTAGEGSDYFVGDVVNNITGAQAAVYLNQVDEDLYVKQIFCLGLYYNTALIGLEVNFSSYPEMELERLNYTNLYVREVTDTYLDKYRKAFGFKTTSVTRPLILDSFKEVARTAIENIKDIRLLREMLTFVKNDSGRPEAAEGEHDDLVMAHAITLHVRSQQKTSLLVNEVNEVTRESENLYEEDDVYGADDDIFGY